MSSKDEFIIKRADSTTDIFRKWDKFITAAKAAKLIDIFNGKTSVKSDEEVDADNKSRLSYLKTALIKQTLIQESNLTIQIMQEIEANELYAQQHHSEQHHRWSDKTGRRRQRSFDILWYTPE